VEEQRVRCNACLRDQRINLRASALIMVNKKEYYWLYYIK